MANIVRFTILNEHNARFKTKLLLISQKVKQRKKNCCFTSVRKGFKPKAQLLINKSIEANKPIIYCMYPLCHSPNHNHMINI